MRWRVVIGVFFHEGKACLAALTAALNSSYIVKWTWDTTSCVAWVKINIQITFYINHHNAKKISSKYHWKTYQLTGFITSMITEPWESTNFPPIKFETFSYIPIKKVINSLFDNYD